MLVWSLFPSGPTARWTLITRPDRRRPTLYGWWTPVALRYIKRLEVGGSGYEVHRSLFLPPTNPKPDLWVRGTASAREAPPDYAATSSPWTPLHRLPPWPSRPMSRASPTKEMAATGWTSTAPTVLTDSLWTPPYLYLLPPPSLCHSSFRSCTRIWLITPKERKFPSDLLYMSYSTNR
jgi:hypothetical protein